MAVIEHEVVEAPEVEVEVDEDAELLKAAQMWIEHGWCQGAPAHTSDGVPCGADNPDAVSFCAQGGLIKALLQRDGELQPGKLDRAWRRLVRAVDMVGPGSVTGWNDREGRTKEEVVEAFERAIELE